jgi:hypothetical protein
MVAVVLRGQSKIAIGAHDESGSASSTAAVAPGVTIFDPTGVSQLLHFFGHQATVSAWGAAPSGYTNQAAISPSFGLALNTKNDTTSDGSVSQALTSSSGTGYRGATLEIVGSYKGPYRDTNSPLGNSTSSSMNLSITAAAGAYAIAEFNCPGARNVPSSVTYAGMTMVQIGIAYVNGSTISGGYVVRYGLANVPGGTSTVTATAGGSGNWFGVVHTFNNVGSVATTQSTFGSGTSVSQTVSSVRDQFIFQTFIVMGSSIQVTEVSGGMTFSWVTTSVLSFYMKDSIVPTTFAGTISSSTWAGIATMLNPRNGFMALF